MPVHTKPAFEAQWSRCCGNNSGRACNGALCGHETANGNYFWHNELLFAVSALHPHLKASFLPPPALIRRNFGPITPNSVVSSRSRPNARRNCITPGGRLHFKCSKPRLQRQVVPREAFFAQGAFLPVALGAF